MGSAIIVHCFQKLILFTPVSGEGRLLGPPAYTVAIQVSCGLVGKSLLRKVTCVTTGRVIIVFVCFVVVQLSCSCLVGFGTSSCMCLHAVLTRSDYLLGGRFRGAAGAAAIPVYEYTSPGT